MTFSPLVVWHDVECGRYAADLALWRELAAGAGGAVLDVGAGTGRVALDLAAAGFDVTALDREPALLAALGARARAAGVSVARVAADARSFSLGRTFGLAVVPMQTLQLLPERAGFFASVRRCLVPGGLLAAAIVVGLEAFEAAEDALPAPDVGAADGWRFASQPTAVRVLAGATRIERVRRSFSPEGEVLEEDDRIELARVSVAQLCAEGREAGFACEPARSIPATADHVGSEVVLLRA